MFSNISWTNYLFFVGFMLVIYYVTIGVKFYSNEFRSLLNNIRSVHLHLSSTRANLNTDEVESREDEASQPVLFSDHSLYIPTVEEPDESIRMVQELTAALKATIDKAVAQEYIKEEFIQSLRILLRKYSFLRNSIYLASLNNLIASECERYDYIRLSAEERVMLWSE